MTKSGNRKETWTDFEAWILFLLKEGNWKDEKIRMPENPAEDNQLKKLTN